MLGASSDIVWHMQDNMNKDAEYYLRIEIANKIAEYGKIMDKTIPLSSNEISHGEYFLKHWTQYIVNNCIEIALGDINEYDRDYSDLEKE